MWSFCRSFLSEFVSDGILRCGFCCSFEFKYGIKNRGVGPGPSGRGGGGARSVKTDGGLQ